MTGVARASVAVPGESEARLRRSFGGFATGITVVTGVRGDGRPFGLTASSFQCVSLAPPLVLFSVRRGAASLRFLDQHPHFCVNVLTEDQAWLARQFAAPVEDRFQGASWQEGLQGCPLLAHALASFECDVHGTFEGGDHRVVLGQVRRHQVRDDGEPLLYFRGAFRNLGSPRAGA